jgi:cobalamin biosynthesis Mg chelatase CobN
MLQAIYREIDFDDEQTARQERDAHLAELEAQGMECLAENLYNALNGRRVFTLVATPPVILERSAARAVKLSSSEATEPPQRSVQPKPQEAKPQRLPVKRVKLTYDVR